MYLYCCMRNKKVVHVLLFNLLIFISGLIEREFVLMTSNIALDLITSAQENSSSFKLIPKLFEVPEGAPYLHFENSPLATRNLSHLQPSLKCPGVPALKLLNDPQQWSALKNGPFHGKVA